MAPVTERAAASSGLTDPEHFRISYAAALPRVYAYLHRRCGRDTALAEDLTQEVFLAVVHELRRGTSVVDPIPWALGIARHKLLDHIRRQRRTGWTLISWDDGGSDDAVMQDAVLAAVAQDAASDERASAALSAVPSPQREALILRYLDELPVIAVAAALGRSIGATESLLVRGRVAFRRTYLETRDDG